MTKDQVQNAELLYAQYLAAEGYTGVTYDRLLAEYRGSRDAAFIEDLDLPDNKPFLGGFPKWFGRLPLWVQVPAGIVGLIPAVVVFLCYSAAMVVGVLVMSIWHASPMSSNSQYTLSEHDYHE